jgi:hypothetical protein
MLLAFLSGRSCTGLEKSGAAPFGKPDVDHIEVPRHDCCREDLASFPRDLRPEVAVREVRQHEHANVGGARKLCGADRGGVSRLDRPFVLLGRERRLVDEHVGIASHVQDRARGGGIPGEDDLPPRPRRAEYLLGRDAAPVLECDRFAVLEAAVERPFGDAESRCRIHVEAARAR